MSHRRERALVKRHQLFSIKHRKPLPRTGRPPLYADPNYRTPEQIEALRPPPLFFTDGRRIDA